jgi:histone deacetylase 11
MHPFDSTKYANIFKELVAAKLITSDQVISPWRATHKELRAIHSLWYLLKLHSTFYQTTILEVPIVAILPSSLSRSRVFVPMQYQTGGTVGAALASLVRGWAINLGGGFHHACFKAGGGFCPYADITLAIKVIREAFPDRVKKVMIIDLDAHQGNGHERDFIGDSNTFIVDMYNPRIYPHDVPAKQAISKEIPVTWSTSSDSNYLTLLRDGLKDAFSKFTPDFILYNAGTDCMEGDPLGNLQLSPKGIISRDEITFSAALTRKIPIAMVLSGGYQIETAHVIAQSILNLEKKFNLFSLKTRKDFSDASSSSSSSREKL